MALQVGIVGAGRTGVYRARQLEAYPDVQVSAIADPNRPARDAFITTFGPELAVSDYRRLVLDDRVDIVLITAPPPVHCEIALAAFEVGKHVICEAPIAATLLQAEEMIIASENSSGRFFISLEHRYDPVVQQAWRMIEDDELGYVYLVSGSLIRNDYDRMNDWHDWKGTWDKAGGGVLMECGSDVVDLYHYLIGEIGAVSAICTRFAIEPLHKAEDSCLLGIEFLDDVAADLALTGAARFSAWPPDYAGNAMHIDVYGLEGALRITSPQSRLAASLSKGRKWELSAEEIETSLPTDMLRDFLDCILDDEREPLVTPRHALAALMVILAGYKSSQMKRRVELLEEV